MDKTYIKSNITLEDIRPHISRIYAYFGVLFDDGGFMMTEQEIKKAKEDFDNLFVKSSSMILGIEEEKTKAITKTNKYLENVGNETFKQLKTKDLIYHIQTRPIDNYVTVEKYEILEIHKGENIITLVLQDDWHITVNPNKSLHKRNNNSYIATNKKSMAIAVEKLLKK